MATYSSKKYPSGSVTSAQLADGTVVAVDIASNAITTAKIADANITPAKMANSGAEFGMRNRIINGAMVIDQRNAGAAVASGYGIDRWLCRSNSDGVLTFQQSSTAPDGFNYSMLVTTTTADASLSSTQFVSLVQYIEGFNFADMNFGTAGADTVTLSFWVRSSLTGTFGGSLSNNALNRGYPFTYTISVANTFEYKTVTITGDTSGTWVGATNGIGCRVTFGLGVGSAYSGTAGAWAAGEFMSPTGATSVVGTNGATFYITGVQLEKGSTATAFDYRNYGHELQLCQRYYEKFGINQRQFWTTSGQMTTKPYSFKATKRATPSITITNAYTVDGWTSYGVETHGGSITGGYDINNIVGISATSSGGGNTIAIIACQIEASAEL